MEGAPSGAFLVSRHAANSFVMLSEGRRGKAMPAVETSLPFPIPQTEENAKKVRT